MRITRQSESLWILRDLPLEPFVVSRHLSQRVLAGLIEAVPSYDSVGLYADPDVFDSSQIPVEFPSELPSVRVHQIKICYQLGPDIESVTQTLGISFQKLIELHSSPTYRCVGLGFCPGFAYLTGLAPELSGLPRLPSPRTAVPAGSLGITGSQTAVYPSVRPGGWNLIGLCPQVLVDVETGFFPIEPGDQVKFEPIDAEQFAKLVGTRLGE